MAIKQPAGPDKSFAGVSAPEQCGSAIGNKQTNRVES